MARVPRLHVPGGFYHVTLRGNHRQPIFFSPHDFDLLGEIVAEVIAAHGAYVHAYCWMTNHAHLLLQVSDVPLGRVMLRIASRYARTVQAHLSTTGHLFEKRYHSTLIDVDRYFLAVLRYIHLNPVKARLAPDLLSYPHSSHSVYIGRQQCTWVRTDFAMNLIAVDPEAARAGYRELMDETAGEPDDDSIAPHPAHRHILGDDDFVSRILGSAWRPRVNKSLDDLICECHWRFGVTPDLLKSSTKAPCVAAARAWVAHEAISGRIASVSAVARSLNRSESSIRELMIRRPREIAGV